MTNKLYKIIEALTGLILVFAVVLTMTIVSQITSKGYVTIGGYGLFKVATGSMEPTIETGSLIMSSEIDIEDVRINDIICFESNNPMMLGQVITHRVVGIGNVNGVLRLTTKGDANTVEDALYVIEEDLIGKVVWYSESDDIVASFISFLNGKIGFLSCIVFPVLLISALMMRECLRNIEKEIRELKRLEALKNQKTQESPKNNTFVLSAKEEAELIARLRKEIREELGLDETK